MYILEYSVGKRSADVLQDKILYHIQKRRPEKTGIEAYQAQSMIVTFLKKRLSEMNIHTTVEELTQAGDKFTKIRRLVVLYRDGLIFHRQEMLELENELKRFPRGKHDDMIDAEQMLYSLYELQPNSTNTYDMNFERDKNGVPIQQEFYPEKRL
jgi:predicted phage terminase large subunit-like protein